METNKAAHQLETLADDQHCHHDHTTQQNPDRSENSQQKQMRRNKTSHCGLRRATSRLVWHILALEI